MAGKIVLSGLALSLAAAHALGAGVLWDRSVNLRGAFGYKDNVLLRSFQPDGSAFWQTSADFMLLRASTAPDAPSFTFFASAEDRRYFSAEEVRKEQLLLSQIKWDKPFWSEWRFGAVAQYVYADQVFDASATEELISTLPVKSHNLQAAPFVSRALPWESRIEIKFNIERQFFSEPLDDYWELGPQLTWTKRYGHRSEVALGYTYDHRSYDERQQFGLDRRSIPDTSLRFEQHELEASLTHVWDKARHWRSRVRFLYERNEDNGPGYYDYDRYRWSKRIAYYGESWEATVEGKILHYDYVRQLAAGTDEIRNVWEYAVAVRAEKNVWKTLKVFAESEHEVVNSNYALEEYKVNTVFGGVDWEF